MTLVVAGGHVRLVAENGSLLRELRINPDRDYPPLGARRTVLDLATMT